MVRAGEFGVGSVKTFLLQAIVSVVVSAVGTKLSLDVLQLQGSVLMFAGMVVGGLNLGPVLVVGQLARKG